MSFARFDGTAGFYFNYAGALPDTMAYPFFVSAWVRMWRQAGTSGYIWSSAKADQSNGTWGSNAGNKVNCGVAGAGPVNFESVESLIGEPYWDFIIWEYRSATDRRIWLNGNADLGASSSTSISINLSSGSPNTRIGISSSGSAGFKGDIALVSFGPLYDPSGLTFADRDTLKDYIGVGMPPGLANGAVQAHYALDGNGDDIFGIHNMTVVGTPVYVTGSIAAVPTPTRQEVIEFIHGVGNTLRSELPTITTVAGPMDTSGWSNLASVEQFDMSYNTTRFDGGTDTITSRGWHYIPTVSNGHCMFNNGGHEGPTEWDNSVGGSPVGYNFWLMCKDAIEASYGVFAWLMPNYGVDTGQAGGSGGHDQWWAYMTDTYTPIEVFLAPAQIAMNNLVNRYSKRSSVGLSGGARLVVLASAIDTRFNHATVATRGVAASRQCPNPSDFEQNTYPHHWKIEEYQRLAASTRRRYWELRHPSDIFAVPDPDEYQIKFLDPIMTEFPNSDVQTRADTTNASAAHGFYQGTWDAHIEPALSGALAGGAIPAPLLMMAAA